MKSKAELKQLIEQMKVGLNNPNLNDSMRERIKTSLAKAEKQLADLEPQSAPKAATGVRAIVIDPSKFGAAPAAPRKVSFSDYPLAGKWMPKHQKSLVARYEEEEKKGVLDTVEAMLKQVPGPYSQEGKGNNAVVYAHYFYGQSDWYVTEFHPDGDDARYDRFFGYVVLNGDEQNAEMGYISVAELVDNGKVELDFYWSPKTLAEVKGVEEEKTEEVQLAPIVQPMGRVRRGVDTYDINGQKIKPGDRVQIVGLENVQRDDQENPYNLRFGVVRNAQNEDIDVTLDGESGSVGFLPANVRVVTESEQNKGSEITLLFPQINKHDSLELYKDSFWRKGYFSEPSQILKTVSLDPDAWWKITNTFLDAAGDLWEDASGKPIGGRVDGKTQVVKVTNSATGETLYVNTEGYEYARYVGFDAPPEAPTGEPEPTQQSILKSLEGIKPIQVALSEERQKTYNLAEQSSVQLYNLALWAKNLPEAVVDAVDWMEAMAQEDYNNALPVIRRLQEILVPFPIQPAAEPAAAPQEVKTPYFSYKIGKSEVALKTDFNPDVVTAARKLNGKWDSYGKVWRFDVRDLERMQAFLRDIFGTDGLAAAETVDVKVFLEKLPSRAYNRNYGESVFALGRQLAHRKYRDNRVILGDKVSVLEGGGFPSTGGSAKNPRLEYYLDTVLLVRDVPRSVVEKDELNCEGCYEVVGAPVVAVPKIEEQPIEAPKKPANLASQIAGFIENRTFYVRSQNYLNDKIVFGNYGGGDSITATVEEWKQNGFGQQVSQPNETTYSLKAAAAMVFSGMLSLQQVKQKPTDEEMRRIWAIEKLIGGFDLAKIQSVIETIFNKKMPEGVPSKAVLEQIQNMTQSSDPRFEPIPDHTLKMYVGKKRQIRLPNGEKHNAQFALVELGDILASHNEETFADTPGYPRNSAGNNLNDRNYATDPNAQALVDDYARDLDPDLLLALTSTPEGTPIVTPDGIVVSGNNRTMSLKLARKKYPERWKAYQDALRMDLDTFGLDDAEMVQNDQMPLLDRMKAPVLVRVDYDFGELTTANMAKYNASATKAKAPVDRAVELSTTIREQALCEQRIPELLGDFDTLGDFYADRKATTAMLTALQQCGVINPQDMAALVDNGLFTEEGKTLVERVLSAVILEPDVVQCADRDGVRALRQAVVYALTVLLANKALPADASLAKAVNDAVCWQSGLIASGLKFGDYLTQGNLFDTEPADYRTLVLNRLMASGQRKFREALRKYNNSMANASQGSALFASETVTPAEAFEGHIAAAIDADDLNAIKRFVKSKYKAPAAPVTPAQTSNNEKVALARTRVELLEKAMKSGRLTGDNLELAKTRLELLKKYLSKQ